MLPLLLSCFVCVCVSTVVRTHTHTVQSTHSIQLEAQSFQCAHDASELLSEVKNFCEKPELDLDATDRTRTGNAKNTTKRTQERQTTIRNIMLT